MEISYDSVASVVQSALDRVQKSLSNSRVQIPTDLAQAQSLITRLIYWIAPLVLFEIFYAFLLYPAFISSLRKVPHAHWSVRFSSFWILWKRWTGKENESLDAAHQLLGPIIRVGPNEVSVNSFDGGIRDVYSGGFEKHTWYANYFDNYGVPNMFSMPESKPHSERKRTVAHIHSKSYLQSSEDVQALSSKIVQDRLVPFLESHVSTGKSVELLELLFSTTMDLVTAFQFGLPNSTNFLEEEDERKHWLLLYQKRHVHHLVFWAQELPGLSKALSYLGIRLLPKWVNDANKELEKWCLKKCDGAISTLDSPEPTKPGDNPVIVKALHTGLQKSRIGSSPTSPLTLRLTIASELLDHLAAGHETSSLTLANLIYNLSKHSNLQRLLQRELRSLPLDPVPLPRDLDKLPLLHALVQETLRLTPPIPGPQPRITPSEGCVLTPPSGKQYYIPPRTRISASAYCLHRNEVVFPSPLSWRPDRWLDDAISTPSSSPSRSVESVVTKHTPAPQKSANETKERYFWAFGSGGRMCLGSNLAMLQMKLLIAVIYSRYRTVLEPGQEDALKPQGGYMGYPKAGRLMVRFEKWDLGSASRPDSAISVGSGWTAGTLGTI